MNLNDIQKLYAEGHTKAEAVAAVSTTDDKASRPPLASDPDTAKPHE